MVIQIADLVAKVGFEGKEAIDGMEQFSGATRKTGRGIQDFSQKAGIQLNSLKKTWKFMGSFALGAIGKMINATPELQANMAMLEWQFTQIWRTIGQELVPVFEKIVEWVTKLAEWFKNLDPEVKKVIGVVLGLVGALTALKPLLSVLPSLFGPIGLAIAGVIGFFALLSSSSDESLSGIKDAVGGLVESFKGLFASLKEPLEKLFATFVDVIANQIIPFIESKMPEIEAFFENLGLVIEGIGALLEGDFLGVIESIGRILYNAVESWTKKIEEFYQSWWEQQQKAHKELLEMRGIFEFEEWTSTDIEDFMDRYGLQYEKIWGKYPEGEGGGGGGPTGVTVNNYIDVTVDASGSTASALDIGTTTSEKIADKLSNVQNW